MYQSIIASGKKRTYRKKARDFILPDDDQCYAVIKDMLGNGRSNALCYDGTTRLARIRGSLRKGPNKAIVSKGDLVIVSLRDFEEDKVDLVHTYSHDEASTIFRQYQLPEHLKRAWRNDDLTTREDESYIDFEDIDESTTTTAAAAHEDVDVDNI
jgi:translation initiation factor 1A